MGLSRTAKKYRAEIDFSYALDLPFRVRRLACTYEYARECPTLIGIIEEARGVGVFSQSYRGDNAAILDDISRAQSAIGIVDTIHLVDIDEFPARPFRVAWKIHRDRLQVYDQGRSVSCVPWKPLGTFTAAIGGD